MKKNYDTLKWVIIVLIGCVLAFWVKEARGNMLPETHYLPQQQEITGTVTNEEGEPIAGATVAVEGTRRGTITDMDGEFTFLAPRDAVLVVSYLGYKTVKEELNGRLEIHFRLEEDVDALGEVKINAGYYNTTERERTGSISRVTAEEIERQPVTNPLAALQGRMPGVNITQSTGVPGGGFDIQIRGINSIGAGNDPLYIIDGVPFSSQSLGYEPNSLVFPGNVSPLNSINPADIESIEVLKDADATAIYGSRGANGVVLITTKKGRPGKVRLDINMYKGIGAVTHYADLMNSDQYLEMRREAFANDGISEYPANARDVNGSWDQNRYTDWQETLIGRKAKLQELSLHLSGGSAETKFMLGSTIRRETTVFPGDNGYKKVGVLAGLNHSSRDNKLNLDFSANYVLDRNDLPGSDLTRYTRNLAPNAPALYNEDGSLNWADNTWANPLASYVYERFNSKSYNLIANGTISYELFKNFYIKSSFGYNTMELEDKKITPSTRFNPAFNLDSRNSMVFRSSGSRKSWIVEPQVEWKQRMGKLATELLLGSTFQENTTDQLALFTFNYPSNQLLDDISAASFFNILNNQNTRYKYHALFGRINFNWDQKYILNLTGRRDGSSRFGPGNQFANFGAIGAAWIFSEESLFADKDFLSFGKLRGSYGITGNDQIGDYEFLDSYSLSGRNYNNISGLAPTQLFNPNFGWETNKKLEGGLELGFLNDRIFTTASFFLNRSDNQLVGIPLPGTTGFSSLRANLDAEVENRGWEFEARSINMKTENFSWETNFNISFIKNELISYPGLEGSTNANRLVIGKPLNIQKLYELEGVNPETGVYEFVDFNNDSRISAPEDRQFIADFNPRYYGGFSNNFSYKKWNLNIFLQFVGKDNYNHLIGRPGGMINQTVDVLDRWQEPGDRATFQRYTTGSSPDAVAAYTLFNQSSGVIGDASFIRLKNLFLSYSLPENFLEFQDVKFYIQGQNLLTITDYKGADPESNSLNTLPPLTQLTLGVQLTF